MNETEKIIWPGWETGRLIGRGSFGAVYEIQRQMFDEVEKAALKVISIPQSASDVAELYSDGYDADSITETFRAHLKSIVSEYSLMRKMNGSSNIVNCDDVRYIQHDDGIGWDIFIKMELLTPLTETLTNSISDSTVIRIAQDICEALVLCNKHGIVHRDIKPQNIFVSPNGDYKLGDFGIAKTVEKTMGGTKIGTYKYMAPEVYNESAYDTSSDIYSIGVLLYKLLNNNRLPFLPEYPKPVSLNDREVAFEKQMRGEKISPPAKADSEMARIISKALAFRQSDRYFSPTLMKAELDRYTEMLSAPQADAPAYPPVFQAPVYVPVTPAVPLSGFQIADEEQEEEKLSVYLDPDTAVSEAEKVAFRKAFKEDSATDEDTDDGKDNKKMYLLVAAIIAVIALIIGVIFIGGRSDSSKNTTGQSVILPTVTTTQPPTVATTPPPTVITTTEPSTTESTTETTTEVTTKSTTETTAATTTEPTTTEAPSTQHTEVPELVASDYSDGDIADDGRTYREIGDYTFIQTPEDEFFDEVILEISTPFGENAATQGNVFIYEMAGSSVIQKMTANFEITVSEEDGEPLICCYITVDDGDFYYSPEYYQYYICFDEGAIVSDSAISLPLQLQL